MILSCGEALIDMLPRETTYGEDAFAPYPGGAVFNTAIALGRLGVPSGFISGLSSDLFGEMLRTSLSESKVSSDLAVISQRPTTLAFVRLVDGQATYAFYDENTAGRMLTPGDIPSIPSTTQAMFFGGISLVGEPCAGFYEALIAREAPARVTMIDPNIRPDFIIDELRYRARIKRMTGLADIVKLSDEDLRWLVGSSDFGDLAKEILQAGAKLVLITDGAKGAYAFTRDHTVFVDAHKVDVIDTVGAGDTFNAGVLAALYQTGALNKNALSSLPEELLYTALTLGVRSAAITVSRAGANSPWANEI